MAIIYCLLSQRFGLCLSPVVPVSKVHPEGLTHPIRQPELSRIGDRFPDSQSSDHYQVVVLRDIEDPFEQPVNSARRVSSKQLPRISETFKTTCNKLSSPNQDLSLYISTLVRPRV
nr:protein HESO1-like [Ipomoea trifida]